MNKVLVVGQTPPPYGGQAIMIQYMLDADYDGVKLYHVKMQFSRDLSERGRFSWYKVTHLLSVIINIWLSRIKYHVNILYYPLSSSPKVALIRDVIILAFTRFLFKRVIFHFHAAGISEELPRYNVLFRIFFYQILKRPDLAITSSSQNPKDGEYLQSKQIKVIPLGIPDENAEKARKTVNETKPLRLLFIGLMNSTKGEGYLLEACHLLAKKGIPIELWLAGRFETKEYESNFYRQIMEYELNNQVKYLGIVTGHIKKEVFLNSDIFCFPTFFPSESFGMVLLEAMMYQMPLIATRWRGVQSLIEDGKNGYLVNLKSAEEIANKIEIMHRNRAMISQMGQYSRNMYEKKYKLSIYIKQLEREFTCL